MSRGEFMLMKPPTDEMCRSAKSKFDRAGIRCVSYYSATIKDEKDLDNAVRFAKLLGLAQYFGRRNRRHAGGDRQAIDQRRPDVRDSQSLLQAEIRLRESGRCFESARRKVEDHGLHAGCRTHRLLRSRYGGCGSQAGAISENGAFEGCGARRAGKTTCCSGRASPRSRR